MKLMIVDDDLQTVEVVRDSINWSLFNIDDTQIAYNVPGAKKLFRKDPPDIVISDIEMPRASGIDLLKWVRENEFDTEFIFFTCHEDFEFATTALAYNVISYITKPFDIEEVEMAVSKAVKKIQKEQSIREFKQYGEHWLQNKKFVQENFWRDVLFRHISPTVSGISLEISRRNLPVCIDDKFRLVLISVLKTESKDLMMDEYLFEYTLKKICSEVILSELDFSHTILYSHSNKYYVTVIMKASNTIDEIEIKTKSLISTINDLLKCSVVCYFSDRTNLNELADKRQILEERDGNNLVQRNGVFTEHDSFISNSGQEDILEINLLIELFQKYNKLEISNLMKKKLEMLSMNNLMNASILHTIHQDFMQAIYAFLAKKDVQAHDLFSDNDIRKLNENAENSIIDMMRWINNIVVKTIDYVREVEKSMSNIDKARIFIEEHYMENITRLEVSDAVFLSPDYIGKMFKSEVGISINNYINRCRVRRAQELLLSTEQNISGIAAEVGFENISYFSTVFKKEVGVSPYKFRMGNKNRNP